MIDNFFSHSNIDKNYYSLLLLLLLLLVSPETPIQDSVPESKDEVVIQIEELISITTPAPKNNNNNKDEDNLWFTKVQIYYYLNSSFNVGIRTEFWNCG